MTFPYQIVHPNELRKLAARLETWPAAVLDVEATGAEPYLGSRLVGIGVGAMGLDCEEYFYVPMEGVPTSALTELREVLERVPLLGHNIKYDLHMLAQALGWAGRQERFYDLIVMARLFERGERPDLRLDTLTRQYLGYSYSAEAVAALVKGKAVTVEALAQKNVHDLRATKHLYYYFKERLGGHLLRLFAEETLITRDLYDIERRGQLIDADYLSGLGPRLEEKIAATRGHLVEITEELEFNPSSAPQVQKLMARLGIAPVKQSRKTNAPSWDKEAMLGVRGLHPACMQIARYRALQHLAANIPARCTETLQAGEEALHGTLKNWGTVTGRLSSSDPNRQNDPHGWLQDEADPAGDDVLKWAAGPAQELSVERLFIARPGHVLVNVDYRQIEMYVLGAYMKDKTFDRWLASGNVHEAVALEVWGDGEKFYDRGKVYNFATVYGQGEAARAKLLGCSLEQSRLYKKQYDTRMPGHRRLLDKVRRKLMNDGHVRGFYDREYWVAPEQAYVAVNYLAQGSAGDFVKQRLPAARALRRELAIHVLKTTHDDFTFEVPRESLGGLPKLFAALVENPFGYEFGLDIEWSDTHMAAMRPWPPGEEKPKHAAKARARRVA